MLAASVGIALSACIGKRRPQAKDEQQASKDATDGGSKLSFVDAIRDTGATCAHTAVIFYYGIFPETTQRLADHGVTLHHLCTWWDVLAEARAQGAFDEQTLAEVETFDHPWVQAYFHGPRGRAAQTAAASAHAAASPMNA